MENQITWHFNGNNFGPETGLDTSDMETFKKDPIGSLAREICQNSIDARLKGKKVKVHFKTFEINKNSIPGKERLENEMKSCKEYKKNNLKIQDALDKMIKEINREKITCLRISDFNTTGLLGVENNSSAFYSLTKGSGISDKQGTTGGSKGIGKYASFVASLFNTVFYSTKTIDNNKGYIGISKLCSSTIENSDEKTQGTGYYSLNKKNHPILEDLILDNSFIREESGTDVYILGFNNEKEWKKELITKVLDSFFVAIYNEQLEVEVEDIFISKSNIDEIIENKELILEKEYANIKSQYILLSNENNLSSFKIDDLGEIKVYVKGYGREEASLATNKCIMVRYPYMKIKALPTISHVPCSAMCIIENNQLNEILRDIENPQHTDWELKRLDDSQRKEVRAIINNIKNTIDEHIINVLKTEDKTETDIEGAGDFLPSSTGETNSKEEIENKVSESSRIIKTIKNKVKDKIGIIENENVEVAQPLLGRHIEDGTGAPTPDGSNKDKNGENHDTENEKGLDTNGNNEIMGNVHLSGMKYNFLMTNRRMGTCVLSFNSLYDEKECELEIFHFDDSNTKYPVIIKTCTINNEEHFVVDGKVSDFELKKGEKYKFLMETDLNDYYTMEVKIYAKR